MTKSVACPACGEETAGPVCGSCGAELEIEAAAGSLPKRVASERDQTASDQDQTASDEDQTWSDHDQTASDRDQRSADEDQHAADDDLAAGGDALAYRRSAQARKRSARDRRLVSTMRDETAAKRLETAEDRDQTAEDRDRSADDRDREAELRDRGGAGRDSLARLHDLEDDAGASRDDVLLRAQRDRQRAAADRAKAADDRKRAADDRKRAADDRRGAADDRAEAARERVDARRNRAEAADALAHATTDELTGAWVREFGVAEVARELERAARTGAKLVLAFIDVDLKEVNDKSGHLAGDALLRLVGETIRANIRGYDVLVRYGGDELLCALPNLAVSDARERFEQITTALTTAGTSHSVTFGLAEAEPADSLQDLIGRADDALLEARSSES
jgi:diguanylate cyclase (GGDEF)-like protein